MRGHARFWLAVGAAVVAAVIAIASAGASPDPHQRRSGGAIVETTPPLQQAFSAGAPDYSVPCRDGSVEVHAEVPPGQTVSIDGDAPASGSVDREVPLRAGQPFTIRVDGTTHYVRCVPDDFPTWNVERHGPVRSRFLVFAPTEREIGPAGAPYNVIADPSGVPLWWKRADGATPLTTTVLQDGTVTWARLGGPFSQTHWDHVKLDGTELPPLSTVGVGADHHDLRELPAGNRLQIAYVPREHVDLRKVGGPKDATLFDGEVQELTPDGDLVWSWSTRGHVKLSETASWRFRKTEIEYKGRPAFDLIHMNSVEYDGPNLLISGKNVNAVYLIRRSDGKILWKLGGTHRPESLKVRRDPRGRDPLDAQHDARMQRDGTVSIHDNGTFGHDRLPRVLRYRISGRAATLVQKLRDKRVGHSYCCGSAQNVGLGHWLIAWGANSLIEEVDRHGKRVLALTLPHKLFSYRVQSPKLGWVTRESLRAGMDAQYPR